MLKVSKKNKGDRQVSHGRTYRLFALVARARTLFDRNVDLERVRRHLVTSVKGTNDKGRSEAASSKRSTL
jgi:hypothetical protein